MLLLFCLVKQKYATSIYSDCSESFLTDCKTDRDLAPIVKVIQEFSKRTNLSLGQQESQKKSSKVKTDKKTKMEEDISNLRANLGGLEEFKQDVLTDEDLSRGYKITNMKMLKDFEDPDNIDSEELLKKWKDKEEL